MKLHNLYNNVQFGSNDSVIALVEFHMYMYDVYWIVCKPPSQLIIPNIRSIIRCVYTSEREKGPTTMCTRHGDKTTAWQAVPHVSWDLGMMH